MSTTAGRLSTMLSPDAHPSPHLTKHFRHLGFLGIQPNYPGVCGDESRGAALVRSRPISTGGSVARVAALSPASRPVAVLRTKCCQRSLKLPPADSSSGQPQTEVQARFCLVEGPRTSLSGEAPCQASPPKNAFALSGMPPTGFRTPEVFGVLGGYGLDTGFGWGRKRRGDKLGLSKLLAYRAALSKVVHTHFSFKRLVPSRLRHGLGRLSWVSF